MGVEGRVHFFRRAFPSGNMVLVRGSHPVLIDSGFGSDLPETEALLQDAGVPAVRLQLIANTHYHSDHVGGNGGLQSRYGIPVAAHRWDAALINHRNPEACSAEWLDQPVEPYRVDRPLADGDEIDAGGVVLRVIHTPGHTLGHVSYYAPGERVLICGEALHGDDVPWINGFREGAGALERTLESLDRLVGLPADWACSGHGPAFANPAGAIDTVRRRYEKWLTDPEKLGWHACKRIFAYALMIKDGVPAGGVAPYLLGCPWFQDFSRHVFGTDPADFVAPLVAEMLRSGAAVWRAERLVAATPYHPPAPGWLKAPGRPRDWPPVATP